MELADQDFQKTSATESQNFTLNQLKNTSSIFIAILLFLLL